MSRKRTSTSKRKAPTRPQYSSDEQPEQMDIDDPDPLLSQINVIGEKQGGFIILFITFIYVSIIESKNISSPLE